MSDTSNTDGDEDLPRLPDAPGPGPETGPGPGTDTQRVLDPIPMVMQISIDNALKEAAPMFEGMAREHIPALVERLQADVASAGYSIVPTASLKP
jgi:hypothetical protein